MAANQNTREVAIPWSAITGGGIPSIFRLLWLSDFQRRLRLWPGSRPTIPEPSSEPAPPYTQYYAVTNTGNGTSTPPFSIEQPAGFSGDDKAGFYHNTSIPSIAIRKAQSPRTPP